MRSIRDEPSPNSGHSPSTRYSPFDPVFTAASFARIDAVHTVMSHCRNGGTPPERCSGRPTPVPSFSHPALSLAWRSHSPVPSPRPRAFDRLPQGPVRPWASTWGGGVTCWSSSSWLGEHMRGCPRRQSLPRARCRCRPSRPLRLRLQRRVSGGEAGRGIPSDEPECCLG